MLPDRSNDNATNNFIDEYQIENGTKLKLVYNVMRYPPHGLKTRFVNKISNILQRVILRFSNFVISS